MRSTDPNPDFPDQLLSMRNGADIDPSIAFGHFTLRKLVRKSEMSLVVQGVRTATGEKVAVKICLSSVASDHERFRREIDHARACAGIPGVIKIDPRDSGKTKDGKPFHVTRWIEGPSFADFLANKSIDRVKKLNYVEDLCEIVAAIHKKGLTHRDLKPSNAIVEDGEWFRLLDLGLARSEAHSDLTMSGGHVGGTAGYCPPWILRNPQFSRAYEKRWDVYSLAVILIDALTGVTPDGDGDPNFTPEGIQRLLAKHLPGDHRFESLLKKCLSPDPKDCLPDAGAFYLAIREGRGLPRTTSRRAVLFTLTAVAVIVAGVFAFRAFAPDRFHAVVEWFRPAPDDRVTAQSPPEPSSTNIALLLPERNPEIIENPSITNRALRLQVTPVGATVRLVNHRDNGRLVTEKAVPESGGLELQVPENPNAEYGLIVFKTGFHPNSQSVRVDSVSIAVDLERLRGEVEFKTTPGARLTLRGQAGDARTFGPAPADGVIRTQSLDEGDWSYQIDLSDYEPASGKIQGLVQGKRQVFDQPLKPLPGRVSVVGHRAIDVWSGAARLGAANEWIPLAAGAHELELRRKGFRSEPLPLTIPPNRDISRVAPAFVAESGALRILVEAPSAAHEFFAKASKRVFLDGAPIMVVSFPRVEEGLSIGPRTVRVEVEGFAPSENHQVEIRDAQTTETRLNLQPLPAKLVILADPAEVEVFLDGKERLGIAGQPLNVPSFTPIRVEARAPKHKAASVNLDPLEPNRSYQQRITLERQLLPPFLVAVTDAQPAPLTGLYAGSREAQQLQLSAARTANLPLEVKTAKVGISFRYVPPGTFQMGSPANEAGHDTGEIQHTVTISQGFYAGKFEITQDQWRAVTGANPSHFKDSGGDAPVEGVSWNDIQEFVQKLAALEGVPAGSLRLLTEAEWEWACRAGTTGPTYGPLGDVAWYSENSERKTHPVGRKTPNAFGLHDMAGGVQEWCSDLYGDYEFRVVRGGDYLNVDRFSRSASRHGQGIKYNRDPNVGFRLALSPEPEK